MPSSARKPSSGAILISAMLLSGPNIASAQVLDGRYFGSMECGRLPFARQTLTIQATLTVTGPTVAFSRVVTHSETGGSIGTESGRGRIDAAGRVTIRSSWRARRDSLTGTYSGQLTAAGGTLRGRQTVMYEGRGYPRSCLITLRR